MAFKITYNHLKNGDTTYYIKSSCRVPGLMNKYKDSIVFKYSKNELEQKGIDVMPFLRAEIAKLKENQIKEDRFEAFRINMNQLLELSDNGPLMISDDSKNLGFAAYSRFYHKLELDELINNRRRYLNCKFNINVIFQHLLYSRMLWPDSKLGTWEHRDKFFGDTNYELQHVYRSMDALLKWRTDILNHLDTKIKEKYGRKNTIVFYDVTNYYFEIDDNDDEDGLRAKGCSKEHRTSPIIQMGLFMDENSIPITYELFRGNTNDSSTLKDAMDKCIIDFSDSRKIVVADKAMMTFKNILKIREAKNGYVISQSIRKSDEETKAFVLSDEGWKETKDSEGNVICKIKERTKPRNVSTYSDYDSKKYSGSYNERQIAIWSKAYEQRAKHNRAEIIDKALDSIGQKSANFKDSSYGKIKYLKKAPIKDGKIIDPDLCLYEFDSDKLAEDEKYDGYYLICTNVVGVDSEKKIKKDKSENYAEYRKDGFLVLNHVVSADEIVSIYGGLWKIEETFKVTKTGMMNLRPIFHSADDRIRAHFLICFVALILERLLEKELHWKYSAKTIQESLSSFNAIKLANTNIFQISYYDKVVEEILKVLDIPLTKKFMKQLDIRKLIGQTKKKDYE